MVTLFFVNFSNLDHYAHNSPFQKCLAKGLYGFPFWTFINVQFSKPKVEFTFFLLP
jgi:hypothetical protein